MHESQISPLNSFVANYRFGTCNFNREIVNAVDVGLSRVISIFALQCAFFCLEKVENRNMVIDL